MFSKSCNIDTTDRICRSLVGAVMFIAAILGAGKAFFMIFGLLLFVQGIIGRCSIPFFLKK